MEAKHEALRNLPGVDTLLQLQEVKNILQKYPQNLVKYAIRLALEGYRQDIISNCGVYSEAKLIKRIKKKIDAIDNISLKRVINATGIILHTNLGRAPLGEKMLEDIAPVILGYSNIELDLTTGKRGNRNRHFKALMSYLCQAEDVAVVNNNAAAVFLCLKTFGENGESIISRGELIEIGGSFRLPDIMKASGTKMVEVGTTNKTRLADYENAITENTKILFKAHRSNYYIEGFTEEVDLKELTCLAHKHDLMMIYDLGSGLLWKPKSLALDAEPDIASALEAGVDVVTFSGDKLLGGPQAGIIAGKGNYINLIAKAPLMRALRVGKLTIAALLSAMKNYVTAESSITNVPIFYYLQRNTQELKLMAEILNTEFKRIGVGCQIISNGAFTGGGTLPKTTIQSFAVELNFSQKNAVKLHHFLLNLPLPIVSILREGKILFDVFTLREREIQEVSKAVEKFIINCE